MEKPLRKKGAPQGTFVSDVIYGCVNSVMCIPVMISFTSIIFRDPAFAPYLPKLVKLVLFSSAVHQMSFSLYSSLPFAVGQVQDAGLIFLSAMADSVVQICGASSGKTLPTTLFVVSCATVVLGIFLMIMGKMKLASVVQYLPMPVIGGYLAFIGFFCGEAGLAMMSGMPVTRLDQWGAFLDPRAIKLIAPGLVAGVAIYIVLRNATSPYTLPIFMSTYLTTFYSVMWLTGMSMEEARNAGWIAELVEEQPFYDSWSDYNVDMVEWSAFPPQIFKFIGLFFIVAFSSSLDVAAIEMELGLPLDYNRELETVGISNLLSGCTGGFTGSYIFSQTIFSMRRGVSSRVNGFVIVALQILVILVPVPVTSYIPKAFFGSLLVLIAADLMTEWLLLARGKMADPEYLVCLATFCAILFTGVEVGMLIGILCAMVCFVVMYARMPSVAATSLKQSSVVRTFKEQVALGTSRGKIMTIDLSGYIFFGSAVQILEDLKKRVRIRVQENGSEGIETCENRGRKEEEEEGEEGEEEEGEGEGEEKEDHVESWKGGATLDTRDVRSVAAYTSEDLEAQLITAKTRNDTAAIGDSSRTPRKGARGVSASTSPSKAPSSIDLVSVYDISESALRRHQERVISSQTRSERPAGGPVTPRSSGMTTRSGVLAAGAHATAREKGKSSETDGVAEHGSNSSWFFNVYADDAADDAEASTSSPDRQRLRSRSVDDESLPPGDRRLPSSAGSSETRANASVWAHWRPSLKKSVASLSSTSSPSTSSKSLAGAAVSDALLGDTETTDRAFSYGSAGDFDWGGRGGVSSDGRRHGATAVGVSDVVNTEYLVLNFETVHGVDATAARSCFLMLMQLMKRSGVLVVFAAMRPSVERIFRAQQVLTEEDIVLPHCDDALELCEELTLARQEQAGKGNTRHGGMSGGESGGGGGGHTGPGRAGRRSSYYKAARLLRHKHALDVLSAPQDPSPTRQGTASSGRSPFPKNARKRAMSPQHVSAAQASLPMPIPLSYDAPGSGSSDVGGVSFGVVRTRGLVKILEDYMEIRSSRRNTNTSDTELALSRELDESVLAAYFEKQYVDSHEVLYNPHSLPNSVFFIESGVVELLVTDDARDGKEDLLSKPVTRLSKVSSGGIFGIDAFLLNLPHRCRALTVTECHIWRIDRSSLAKMEVRHPKLCLIIQQVLLKSMALLSNATVYNHHGLLEGEYHPIYQDDDVNHGGDDDDDDDTRGGKKVILGA